MLVSICSLNKKINGNKAKNKKSLFEQIAWIAWIEPMLRKLKFLLKS